MHHQRDSSQELNSATTFGKEEPISPLNVVPSASPISSMQPMVAPASTPVIPTTNTASSSSSSSSSSPNPLPSSTSENTVSEIEPVLALLLYSTCSVSMILLNKLVMDTYNIDFPLGLLFLQNLAALILVVTAKRLGYVHYPAFDMAVVKKWLPLTGFFVLMLWTSMKSLKTMSVAAQTILKNLAIVFTALGDWYWFKKHLSKETFMAFSLMILGSWLGSANDKWVSAEGVFWTFANIAATVGYVLYMKALLSAVQNEIGKYGPVFYNNLLSLPFLAVPAFPSLPDLSVAIENAPPAALLCLFCMVFVGAIMTFGTFWAMRVTTATTYSVTGALNKVPLAFLGIIIFHHYPSTMGYVGISCSLGAGVMYAWTQARERKMLEEQQKRQNRTV